ncbi:MAG: Asp-tRNA(Asn)/Glu-tRNA(Gln) amidotransferase subunit GatB [Sandaracinaceae bacterium]|nr:Asp-tRNA(Asn)/Glu-tRNA(Gln) amidotransferase subunit GatB [Sandaracinaceae bacterium]
MATTYEPVIGLEVHAQLFSKTKMFCGCSISFGAPPNTQVCPVCLALPGALPVPNARAIELAVRAALALGCTVNERSVFARKNYFYPDLSKGYQISQFDLPLNTGGKLVIDTPSGPREVGITRIHVEEDAAKNLHGVGHGTDTLVDFNRAGTALIEIVGEPDLRNADEAEAYLKKLREVLMFVGVNDGNLEEGSFRCDANVSIRPVGQEKFGTRCELKNINSFRFVRKAIEYEITRQEAVLSAGGTITQETRTYSDGLGKTIPMRTKEDAHDYRYFPDPDLPPLVITRAFIEKLRVTAPELAEQKRTRWQKELGVTLYDATVLTGHPKIADYFEEAAAALAGKDASPEARAAAGKKVANFVQSEVLRTVTTRGLEAEFAVSAEYVAELLRLVEGGSISGKMAKDVFAEMITTGRSASKIIEQKGLSQVTDTSVIEAAVAEVLAANASQVEKYKAGKTSVVGFFVGQIMRATKGAANPQLVNDILKKMLDAQ